MSIFNVENPFWQFLNKMTDQFLLSLVWLLCSLPIVTFGAATTAYFSVSMEMCQDLDGSIYSEFFWEFRRCFRRATKVWLLQIVVFLLVGLDFWICCRMDQAVGWFLAPIIAVLGVLFLMASLFTWPLLCRSSAPLRQIWSTAGYITLSYLLHGISMVLLVVMGVFIGDMLSYAAPLLPAIVTYQFARIYVWIFGRDVRVRKILDQTVEPRSAPEPEPEL